MNDEEIMNDEGPMNDEEASHSKDLELQKCRIDNFTYWVNNCPENVYVVDHDDEPGGVYWCTIHVKTDMSLE